LDFSDKLNPKSKRKHNESDGEVILQCKDGCDFSERSKWKYCPLCGQPFTTSCVGKKRPSSTTINSNAHLDELQSFNTFGQVLSHDSVPMNAFLPTTCSSLPELPLSSLALNDDHRSVVVTHHQSSSSSIHITPLPQIHRRSTHSNPFDESPPPNVTSNVNILLTDSSPNEINIINNSNANTSNVDVNDNRNLIPSNMSINTNRSQFTIENVFSDDPEMSPLDTAHYILSDEEVSQLSTLKD
jgi:hypothetical protein